jgi:hypothetical protein
VPCAAGNLLCYANLPRTRWYSRFPEIFFGLEWEVQGSSGGGIGDFCLSVPRVRREMAGDLRSERSVVTAAAQRLRGPQSRSEEQR